jgi:heme-degrading monooxygenase HmoA
MYLIMTIHTPHREATETLRDSMLRFGEAISTQPGFIDVHTILTEDGRLIGMAFWETQEAYERGRAAGGAAVKDDPFDRWESEPVVVYKGETCAAD